MLNPRSIPACGELFDIEMIDDPIHRSALACAGNSHSCWIFNINQSVHPRLRGTRFLWRQRHEVHRFIPACAGNSTALPKNENSKSVHPRLRGELNIYDHFLSSYGGSSPLTRGTPCKLLVHCSQRRFIPAYAGNSISCQVAWMTSDGSSPLTRGTLEPNQQKIKTPRFIPAYAGNSCPESLFRPQASVHPRLRGELGYFPRRQSLFVSSSPLTRGTPAASFASCSKHRFIPAYAGNSLIRRPTKTAKSVHPRLRGELA